MPDTGPSYHLTSGERHFRCAPVVLLPKGRAYTTQFDPKPDRRPVMLNG